MISIRRYSVKVMIPSLRSRLPETLEFRRRTGSNIMKCHSSPKVFAEEMEQKHQNRRKKPKNRRPCVALERSTRLRTISQVNWEHSYTYPRPMNSPSTYGYYPWMIHDPFWLMEPSRRVKKSQKHRLQARRKKKILPAMGVPAPPQINSPINTIRCFIV